MKHIRYSLDGGWDLSHYVLYLEASRENLPEEAFLFAADLRNYDLRSHQSLHDAWLELFSVRELSSGSRSETRIAQIECRFLGPFHDLYIELIYSGVTAYRVEMPDASGSGAVAHGDLLMHEVRAEESRVAHEMVFSRGGRIEVLCQGFLHRVIPR